MPTIMDMSLSSSISSEKCNRQDITAGHKTACDPSLYGCVATTTHPLTRSGVDYNQTIQLWIVKSSHHDAVPEQMSNYQVQEQTPEFSYQERICIWLDDSVELSNSDHISRKGITILTPTET